MSQRRTPTKFGFVNWPEPTHERFYPGPPCEWPETGLADTGEGGMECWLIVADSERSFGEGDGPLNVRDVAVTGFELGVLWTDVVPDRWFQVYQAMCMRAWSRESVERRKRGRVHTPYSSTVPVPIEAAVCIGASGRTIFDYRTQDFWRPEPKEPDLTPEGVAMYDMLVRLYGYDCVHIVLVLDT